MVCNVTKPAFDSCCSRVYSVLLTKWKIHKYPTQRFAAQLSIYLLHVSRRAISPRHPRARPDRIGYPRISLAIKKTNPPFRYRTSPPFPNFTILYRSLDAPIFRAKTLRPGPQPDGYHRWENRIAPKTNGLFSRTLSKASLMVSRAGLLCF